MSKQDIYQSIIIKVNSHLSPLHNTDVSFSRHRLKKKLDVLNPGLILTLKTRLKGWDGNVLNKFNKKTSVNVRFNLFILTEINNYNFSFSVLILIIKMKLFGCHKFVMFSSFVCTMCNSS